MDLGLSAQPPTIFCGMWQSEWVPRKIEIKGWKTGLVEKTQIQGIQDDEATKIMDDISAAMVAEVKAKINWEHLKENQGPWPRKTIVNLWFGHGTEMGMMVQLLENPAIPLAEKIVELLVIQTEEKTRQSVNACVQHVVNAVEVEKYKIIELTAQRTMPTTQEKINQETKLIEIPLLQFMDKAIDIPVVAQRQISLVTWMFRSCVRVVHSCHRCDEVDECP